MSSSTFWHNLLKLSGELAKLEDPGARVRQLLWEAAWCMLTVALISGKDVAQLLLGVSENKSVVIMLWRCWLLCVLHVISMVLLNLLIALASDCADVEFQLLRG
ncbi:hypothetical protein PTSG_13146 [Salpingoeca rosetta]|uniref:Uncharacterized protein n=1 Tax=Salpingoeca rosetta (strain ATCC 50818 / BSB-021) TaxID=946362 RepID=F2USJ9_SALR5|nr:uncharacterized protein PTSG_13146 [Salpingoeca rosetta]EGD81108.1 hypothetical protein PTSG_13146 [Salpingoeca rosetta]|eukprot:XP_004987793.1 hypothetical protein PTSG_13146 [Salpingoeca rosetta]